MSRCAGKVVIVTGASAGIGKQSAVSLAEAGATLAICARRTEMLADTAARCEAAGAEVLPVTCDVSQRADLERLVDATVERFDRIDVLVNNASVTSPPVPFVEQGIDDLDRFLHTGLRSYWNLMQLCYPHLRGRQSSIINVTSGAYQAGTAGMAAYAADKAAIRAVSMVVAREWGKDGIRCNTVSPTAITDTMTDLLPPEVLAWVQEFHADNALGRVGEPATDVAPVMVFLASDDSRWITGQNLNVDGGLSATISI